MGFQSILGFKKQAEKKPEDIMIPKYFYDLNLDQVVQNIMDHQKLYDIRRYYYEKAESEDMSYRLDVMRDIEKNDIFKSIEDFTISMRSAKGYLNYIPNVKNAAQKQKLKLDSALLYINSVIKFTGELDLEPVTSLGLEGMRDWLHSYIESEDFRLFRENTEQLMKQFYDMKYNIRIKRDRIIIEQGFIEEDYCKQLQEIFGKDSGEDFYYHSSPFTSVMLSPLEEKIIAILKKTYKQTFQDLEEYDKKYDNFMDSILTDFETEVQFYIAFREYRDEMMQMNFHFCYPEYTEQDFDITDGYDLALARKNAEKKKTVICNDCNIRQREKFLVITGPNQGGKTTYARTVGQILYFSTIGLMVPAQKACIPVFDGIYTHFAAEESMKTGSGKLKEELNRLNILMGQVTKHSFVLINEIFTSATTYDAYIMGKRVIDYFIDKECLGVYVTHIHELTKGDDRIVSMVASLLPTDSNVRTFKIVRKCADGRSYANTIVEKYHMTYDEIKERIRL